MGFVESIKTCFSKYFVFSGRATRSEFWYFGLFFFIGGFFILTLDGLFFPDFFPDPINYGPLEVIYSLGMFIPYISVAVRRLHDVNRSGWWYWIQGTIIGIFFPFLYWMIKPSDNSANKYGPKPAK